MGYTIKQIRNACQRCRITIWEDELIYALKHATELTYDDSRVYFEEERARDQRLDCMAVRW